MCYGIISGFAAGIQTGIWTAALKFKAKNRSRVERGKTGFELWCAPTGVTIGQTVAVFMRWAERNPSVWHIEYPVGIIKAFKEAWPCKK